MQNKLDVATLSKLLGTAQKAVARKKITGQKHQVKHWYWNHNRTYLNVCHFRKMLIELEWKESKKLLIDNQISGFRLVLFTVSLNVLSTIDVSRLLNSTCRFIRSKNVRFLFLYVRILKISRFYANNVRMTKTECLILTRFCYFTKRSNRQSKIIEELLQYVRHGVKNS